MFTNKTIWQQLFNIALIVTMLVSLIVIYFNVITLISGPVYRESYDDFKGWSCGIGYDQKDGEELTESECIERYDEYKDERYQSSKSEAVNTIIDSIAFILFPGIFLYLTNKYERRSSKIGVLILDIILLSMMISGFVAVSVSINSYFYERLEDVNQLITSVFRYLGLILFPGIIYYILVRKSIVRAQK
ncbi:hypothetical protein KHQ82_10290 [Mycoplasmatota bacterium]|nr:hypothetical protein KHQ82_10290 [Mycoplasmatota bacterium]